MSGTTLNFCDGLRDLTSKGIQKKKQNYKLSSHRCVFVGFEGIIQISNFFTSAKLKLLEVDLLLKRFGVSGWFGISSIQSLRLRVMGEKRSQTTTSDNEYIPAASKKGFNLHLLEVADLHLLEVVGDLQLGDQVRSL